MEARPPGTGTTAFIVRGARRPSIILDYSGTSRRWADVRDEMREVAPGLYVGAMYLRRCPEPRLKLLFVLRAEPGGCPAGPPAW